MSLCFLFLLFFKKKGIQKQGAKIADQGRLIWFERDAIWLRWLRVFSLLLPYVTVQFQVQQSLWGSLFMCYPLAHSPKLKWYFDYRKVWLCFFNQSQKHLKILGPRKKNIDYYIIIIV